ncbi:MAG: hypothetical protein OIF47_07405 [Marinibacterium sp.]|nr:hypothetical protein [Marinibacterium sp.]
MKAMFAGLAAVIVIGIAAYLVLGEIGFSSAERRSGDAVRLD